MPKERVAVAVSGGADSMGLALALAEVRGADTVQAFSVDHGLRHGGGAEARWTKGQLAARAIACDVLTVDRADTMTGNVQASARLARYALMAASCEAHGIKVLCTAHSLDDQAETVLARLARGSGTKGLAGMKHSAPVPGCADRDIYLLRPVLDVRRKDLRAYLTTKTQRWAQDPSNANRQYDRIRHRDLLTGWEEAGFTPERIAAVADNMRRSDDALEHYADAAFKAATMSRADATLVLDREALTHLPIDTQLRCLRQCLTAVSGVSRAIRHSKLNDCLAALTEGSRQRLTLHGCIIDVAIGQVIFRPEHGKSHKKC